MPTPLNRQSPGPLRSPRGTHLEAGARSEYFWDMGLLPVAPCGPPGTPCRVVRLHAPVCTRVFSFAYKVVGGKAVLPDPTPQSDNEVFLSARLGLQAPGFTPSGETVDVQGGEYHYLCLVPPQIAVDMLATGKSPFDGQAAETRYVGPENFSKGVMGAPPPVGNTNQALTPKLG